MHFYQFSSVKYKIYPFRVSSCLCFGLVEILLNPFQISRFLLFPPDMAKLMYERHYYEFFICKGSFEKTLWKGGQ